MQFTGAMTTARHCPLHGLRHRHRVDSAAVTLCRRAGRGSRMKVDLGTADLLHLSQFQCKRRKVSLRGAVSGQVCSETEASLPTLQSAGYFSVPCLSELAVREFMSPGYCSRVVDFTVGRFRWHEVVVYEDESSKPAVGMGLNKPAEVTLLLKLRSLKQNIEDSSRKILENLQLKTKRQGAQFISFDSSTGEWKFLVQHFSRFGLSDDEEEDIAMDDVSPEGQDPLGMNGRELSDINEETSLVDPTLLSHSLPAHLGLDPVKMKEIRMLMFPSEEENLDDYSDVCRSYIEIVEKQLEVPGLSSSSRIVLMHQAMVWELIKVLFSSRQVSGKPKSLEGECLSPGSGGSELHL
nr:Nuclear pore complex protein NUP96 [Ipomoea batatas]GME17907.1 Nuclear pore complex protein NUP96 [Ipomoea batatas]